MSVYTSIVVQGDADGQRSGLRENLLRVNPDICLDNNSLKSFSKDIDRNVRTLIRPVSEFSTVYWTEFEAPVYDNDGNFIGNFYHVPYEIDIERELFDAEDISDNKLVILREEIVKAIDDLNEDLKILNVKSKFRDLNLSFTSTVLDSEVKGVILVIPGRVIVVIVNCRIHIWSLLWSSLLLIK